MKDGKQKRYVIYSRKSKFTGKGESIENQIELCRQYIAANVGKTEADMALVYEDEGFSGGNLERPQFKRMMRDSQKIDFEAIVVYRLDRISRNIGDFAKLIDDLGKREIGFISIREQFDTSSPMGRAMMYIASVFSQLERETIAERIRDNMHELAKTGRWLGGNTPTGYESESITSVNMNGKTTRACKLKLIPEEITLVKLVFDKFIETGSLTKTDDFLMSNGYLTKRGKRFTRFAIRGILMNPVYMIADDDAYRYLTGNGVDLYSDQKDFDGEHGIMAYNRTSQAKGRGNQTKPMEEWIVAVGRHQGIIPGATWVRVQKMLERNRSKNYRRPKSNAALLSGVLFCGSCGDYMRPKLTSRLNADGEYTYSYLCTTKERSTSKLCAMKNPNGNLLDKMVIEEIKKLGSRSTDMARMITQAKKQISRRGDDHNMRLEEAKKRLDDNEKAIRALVGKLGAASGTSAEQYILTQIDELHGKREALKSHISDLKTAAAQSTLTEIEFDLIRDMLSKFGENIDYYTVEQKRAAIRTLVRRIVWDGDNAHMYLFGSEGECELPRLAGEKAAAAENRVEPLSEDSK